MISALFALYGHQREIAGVQGGAANEVRIVITQAGSPIVYETSKARVRARIARSEFALCGRAIKRLRTTIAVATGAKAVSC